MLCLEKPFFVSAPIVQHRTICLVVARVCAS